MLKEPLEKLNDQFWFRLLDFLTSPPFVVPALAGSGWRDSA